MHDFPKPIRRKIRELAGQAYAQDLAAELTILAEHFEAWKRGEIDSFEIGDLIHKFHQGAGRELFSRYNTRGIEHALVAHAVVRGLLERENIPDEVWPYLEGLVELYRKSEE